MTLSEADTKLRHAHQYLWQQLVGISYCRSIDGHKDLREALRIFRQLITDNERERMRAIRLRFAQSDVVSIGNGLYARTRGGR